jgi:hypothetical protein
MKMSKDDLIKKVILLLTEATDCIPAHELAKSCGVEPPRIYTIIRCIKEGGKDELPIGIHSVSSGYILSEFASKQHDVEFFRRLNGARTSVWVTANAAAPWIRKRWNTVEDKRAFELIMNPLIHGDYLKLKQGAKILLDKTKAGV